LKLNQHEAARLLRRQDIGPTASFSDDDAIAMAGGLARLSDEAQVLTRGENGTIACHSGQATAVPGVQIVGPTDTVGAGDTVTAALAACRGGAGKPLQEATRAN